MLNTSTQLLAHGEQPKQRKHLKSFCGHLQRHDDNHHGHDCYTHHAWVFFVISLVIRKSMRFLEEYLAKSKYMFGAILGTKGVSCSPDLSSVEYSSRAFMMEKRHHLIRHTWMVIAVVSPRAR